MLYPQMIDHMALANWCILIAIGGIASALLHLFSRTYLIGTLLLSTLYGWSNLIKHDQQLEHLNAK